MKIRITLLSIFISIASFAQNPWHSINGFVIDNESGINIPFAQVAVKKATEIIAGTTTNSDGSFELKRLAEGEYTLEITFIGYQTHTQKLLISKSNAGVDFGKISLFANEISLNEVQVTANQKTSKTQLDRKSYVATDFETSKGGTAVDLLNKIPSISVSPDGEVSVRGVTDFMVYLNGKPTQMEPSVLLAQLSADAIQSIDVITVPSAKYDAQGKGGVLNIATKQTSNTGISIVANGMYGNAPWNNYNAKQVDYNMTDERYNSGLNLLYNKNKLAMYAGLNYSYKNVNGNRDGDARIFQSNEPGTNEVFRHMVAAGDRPEWYENFTANAGVTYKLSEKSELSAGYYYGKRTEGRSAFYVYNIFYADKNKMPITGIDEQNQWIYNPNTDNRFGDFQTGNLDYSYMFNDKSSLKASLLYEHSGLSRALDNKNYTYNKTTETWKTDDLQINYKQTDDTPLNSYRFSIDYEKELSNGKSLKAGFQPQITDISGQFNYDTLNVSQNSWAAYNKLENGIHLKRNIYAGYAEYGGKSGNFEFNAGIRLEYTDQILSLDKPVPDGIIIDHGDKTEFTVQKLDWFPTVHASYNITPLNKLFFAATRRINRPQVKNMAPFLYRRHLEVYVIGDPELDAEYSNSVELGFEKKINKHDVNITGFYRGTDNAVFRVNTIYDENNDGNEDVLIRSYTNSGNTSAVGAELNANFVAGSVAKFFIGASLYNYRVKGDIFGYQENNSSTNWDVKGNANVFITKALKLTADFNISSATVTAQGQNDLFYMTNAALSYNPQKAKAWTFQAKLADVLSSNIQGLDTRARNADGNELFYQRTTYYRQGPIFELNVSYALNKALKSKSSVNKTLGDQEF